LTPQYPHWDRELLVAPRHAGNLRSFELCFFFQAEDGIRDRNVTGVQTCALPISTPRGRRSPGATGWRRCSTFFAITCSPPAGSGVSARRLYATVAVCAAVVYVAALWNQFALDDNQIVRFNNLVLKVSGVWRAFVSPYWP